MKYILNKFKKNKFYLLLGRIKANLKYQKNKKLNLDKCKQELTKWYYNREKEILDFSNPINFNQKIQWLKLYDNNELKKTLADKYLMRKWISENIDKKYLVKLYGTYNKFEDIDFEKLPKKFVLKCNHGSGYNYIVNNKNKINENIEKKFKKWLKTDYAFINGFELQYKNIEPKIMIEEHLGDNLIDCQFWCSEGKILFISYIKSPHGENMKISYSEKWQKLDFVSSLPILKEEIKKPKKLDEMISIAKKVSKNFKFVRVDFYILNNEQIKISEFTFTPASGTINWYPKKYNVELGKKININ